MKSRLLALAVIAAAGGLLAIFGLVPDGAGDRALIGATLVAFVTLAFGSRRDRQK